MLRDFIDYLEDDNRRSSWRLIAVLLMIQQEQTQEKKTGEKSK